VIYLFYRTARLSGNSKDRLGTESWNDRSCGSLVTPTGSVTPGPPLGETGVIRLANDVNK